MQKKKNPKKKKKVKLIMQSHEFAYQIDSASLEEKIFMCRDFI